MSTIKAGVPYIVIREPIKSLVINGIEYELLGNGHIERLGVDSLIEINAGKLETLTLKEKHPAL